MESSLDNSMLHSDSENSFFKCLNALEGSVYIDSIFICGINIAHLFLFPVCADVIALPGTVGGWNGTVLLLLV